MDPIQTNPALLRYVPDTGFIGRDETLLLLDRAFDTHHVVLLHAYAGQGKTTTAVEFARWYAMTGGLASPRVSQPVVLLTSFETHTDLADVLNQIGQMAIRDWSAINQLDEKRRLVLELLRKIPVLWIWDNVEPVAGFPAGTESSWTADEQRELADFLKQIKLDPATKAKVLLTSRRDEQQWLGGVPHRVQMPRMRGSDAARLARMIADEKQVSRQEIGNWQPLLDYCAGNPLTLSVIAKQAVRQALRTKEQFEQFVQAIRDGEIYIQDADAAQGRDRSLGASLDYGFRHAFNEQELPIVALLHLFQGVVDVDVLRLMGIVGEHALREVQNKDNEYLMGLLNRCAEVGLLNHLDGTWFTIHPALPWFLVQLFNRHFPAVNVLNTPNQQLNTLNQQLNTSNQQLNTPNQQLNTPDQQLNTHNQQLDTPNHQLDTPKSLADASGSDEGRSSDTDALRAWVEAVGELSNHYHDQFEDGNRDVIQHLALEEANLLHARRVARRHDWWSRVIHAMQGLCVLYDYQGRTAQWFQLVAEIVPEYCTKDDQPIPGCEDDFSIVMGYRVQLAQKQDRDLARAVDLQKNAVAWDRRHAAPALAMPDDATLDAKQRNRIRSLGASVFALGQILMDQGSGDCVPAYKEGIRYAQRIGDTAATAIFHYNLGHAYMQIHEIHDLDAAETAYRHSLTLFDENDWRGRSACIKQIGMVHHARFKKSRAAGETAEVQLRHAQAAESHYLKGLALCPDALISDRGPIHQELGILYAEVGQTEQACEHYEKAIQYYEQSGNRYNAGGTRYNMALMYLQSALREKSSSRRETLLRRAQTYAAAALRDYQHYEGRAADMEAKCQNLIDHVQQQLDSPNLP